MYRRSSRGLVIISWQYPVFILLELTRIVGRRKVSQIWTKLFKLISLNCFLLMRRPRICNDDHPEDSLIQTRWDLGLNRNTTVWVFKEFRNRFCHRRDVLQWHKNWNWVCTPTEIQSHDQNFILPTREELIPRLIEGRSQGQSYIDAQTTITGFSCNTLVPP
jgi:hypothetical protein